MGITGDSWGERILLGGEFDPITVTNPMHVYSLIMSHIPIIFRNLNGTFAVEPAIVSTRFNTFQLHMFPSNQLRDHWARRVSSLDEQMRRERLMNDSTPGIPAISGAE